MAQFGERSDTEEESLESQPLLVTAAVYRHTSVHCILKQFLLSSVQRFCIKSQAVCIILLCTVIAGFVHFVAMNSALKLLTELSPVFASASSPFVILYSFVSVVLIFYPVNGFLADVYCGRYKTIAVSLSLILCSSITAVVPVIFHFFLGHYSYSEVVVYAFAGFALLTVVVGMAGYGANFIQFGLDQLFDAPNQKQALFVHWASWCYDLLSAAVVGLASFLICNKTSLDVQGTVIVVGSALFIVGFFGVFLLYVICSKRQLYSAESRLHNPYKAVVMILKFSARNAHPHLRSAFTYRDNETPSRLDFAKEIFGGPFTTEQVEDVKTLFRIVAVLLTLAPIFMMDLLPSNAVLRYYIGLHIVLHEWEQQCTWEWVVLYSGLLRYCVSTLFLPVYIWIVFSLLYNNVPRILCRLGLGISLYFLGAVCLLVIDSVGHSFHDTNHDKCFFNMSNNDSSSIVFPLLGMHWSVLIPFDVLIGIGPTLVTVTTLEFISAQSPRSMKGLLFGLFFAIRGIVQLVTSVSLTPFASMNVWKNLVPVGISCLSGYILCTCVISMLGIVLFIAIAKNYKYRERDVRHCDQRFVVDFSSQGLER